MKNTKKVSLSAITLYCLFGLSAVHFVFLMLGLFNVLTPNCLNREGFNYIVSFVLIALTLAFYVIFLVIESKKNLVVPVWFKMVLYIGLYIFTNVYYYLGWYESIAGIVVAYVFLAFIINIFSLAIFYNSQKAESGMLKVSTTYTGFSVFMISLGFAVIFETIVSTFKIGLIRGSEFATLSMTVIDLCTYMLVSLVMCILFTLSHAKSKRLINGCLIKVYKNEK